MPPRTSAPFRRRNVFVKQGFQLRFALWPLLFLAAFAAAAAWYLDGYLSDLLEYYQYAPHSRLANPWTEFAPAAWRVGLGGGGAFLLALLAWGGWRFGRLRGDLAALAGWIAALARGRELSPLPPIRDPEVRALGRSLEAAAARFALWDEELAGRARRLHSSAEALAGPEPAAALAEAWEAWRELREVLEGVRVDEELS
ncbi:MAG: hypothetical protein Kow0092_34210 [Deferrisomatales bacterium]